MEKNQKQMMAAQQLMAMRQRETMMAVQLAQAKDVFQFFSGFVAVVAVGGAAGVARGKPQALLPMLPLGFLWAYQWDGLYGTKMTRVRQEADRLLVEERERFLLPKSSRLMSREQYRDMMDLPEPKSKGKQ